MPNAEFLWFLNPKIFIFAHFPHNRSGRRKYAKYEAQFLGQNALYIEVREQFFLFGKNGILDKNRILYVIFCNLESKKYHDFSYSSAAIESLLYPISSSFITKQVQFKKRMVSMQS